MSCFAESSPLSSHISSLDEAQSFLSVYQNASNEVARSSKKYQLEVLDYCTEWDAVVTTRIDKEMADIKKLRETYNHYHDKVDVLRKKVNAQEAKGKSANEVVADKVKRNEQKLDEASSEFEAAAGPLCILYEEVIQQGWRDFYPLVQATIKWESDRSQSEARVFQLLQPGALEAAFHRETGIPMKPASVSNNLASPKVHKKKNAQHQPTSPKKKPASQQTGSQKMKPAPLSPNKSALKFESGEDVHSNQFDSSAAYEPAQRKVDSV